MRDPRNEPLTDQDIVDARPARGPGDGAAERRCILTGRGDGRDALLRLALSPDGDVLPDALARAPGRGAWIGVTREELAQAMATGKLKAALARAFRTGKLTIPADLPELIERALVRALLDRLGLAMRAGHLILGSERIAGEARGGNVVALFHAADAGEDGSRKLDQAWRVGSDAEGSGLSGARLPLDRAALSMALGRENVVHLALVNGGSADRVAVVLQRLLLFTGPNRPSGEPEIAGPVTGPAGEALPGADVAGDELILKD